MAPSAKTKALKDIVIVGAGPAGLSMACLLSKTGLAVTIIDQQSEDDLANPQSDGREIALNHTSKNTLEKIGAWQKIDPEHIHRLNQAKVENGHSPLALEFKEHNNADTPLGYLIANHRIRQSLYQQLLESKNIELLSETKLLSVESQPGCKSLRLSNEKVLTCKLLIAADSRFSATRKMMGIGAKMKDYGRVMIVCNMQHEGDHQHIAQECFHYGHTCAILPLGQNESSIVITVNAAKATQLRSLDDKAFALEASVMLGARLGKMTMSSKRCSYPLIGCYADHLVSERFALIGDAAVGMHPVTAHGFNLGLHSAQVLTKHIVNAQEKNKTFWDHSVLKRYSLEHQFTAKPIYEATNLIVKLFNNESPGAKIIRKAALSFAHHCKPLQKIVTRKLTRHSQLHSQ